jgi:2-dehydropantoate 2-reductase
MKTRIAVVGLGGVGGYVGAKLAAAGPGRSGYDLAFVARGAHLEAIRAGGLAYRGPDGAAAVVRPDRLARLPAGLGPLDLVFLCVKGYDLADAARSLVPCLGPESVVIPLLNGADIHRRVRAVLPVGRVLPACIYISAAIDRPSSIAHTAGKGNLMLGGEPGAPDFDPAPLRGLLDGAGIPYEWFADPFPAIWTKFLFIAAVGLVTGWSGKTIYQVAMDPELAAAAAGIQAEIVAVAAASGVVLPADAAAKSFARAATFAPDTTTSLQRDLEVPGKPNEAELFGGTIIDLGRRYGVPTPTTERIYGAIAARIAAVRS